MRNFRRFRLGTPVMLGRAKTEYSSPKLSLMFRSLENAASAVSNFESMAANRSPTITEQAHALKVKTYAQKLADGALRFEAEIYAEHSRLREALDREINEKARLTALPSGAEIRQAMRQMSEKDRMQAVSRAFQDGDHEVLSALIHGNLITTSIPDSLRKDYAEQFQARMCPELVAERAQVDGLLADSSRPLKIAREVAKNSTDEKYIAEIQKADAEARKIESDFEASLGGEPA